MTDRAPRSYLAGMYVAQEAKRAGTLRSHDADYASGRTVDTEGMRAIDHAFPGPDPRVAPQLSILPLRNLQFTLPMPPSCNALYGIGRNGQKYLLPEQVQFRSAVIAIVRGVMRDTEQRGQPLAGRIEISTNYFFNNRRRIDIRNLSKSLDDALEHAGAFANDCQIDAGHDYRIIEDGAERCEVRLREIAA